MNRPLMQHGVGQLEQLFAASKADSKVLRQLENELRFRQVPRAVALLAEVQGALYAQPAKAAPRPSSDGVNDGPSEPDLLKPPPVQPPLWTVPAGSEKPIKPPEQPPTSGQPTVAQAPAVVAAPSPPPAVDPKPAGQRESAPPPLVTLADAYKLFKATASSTWESIEQTRRLAVQASSPTRLRNLSNGQQVAAREEARRLNAAYEVLSRARSSPARP